MTLGRFAAATHVVAVLLLGVLVLTRPGQSRARVALEKLEAQRAATRAELASLPATQAETARLEASWKEERQFLPEREAATEASLLKAINDLCELASVRLDEVIMRPEKAPDPTHQGFDEVGIGVRLTGSYDSLVKLMTALEARGPWIQIVAFAITRPEKGPSEGVLRASLEVVTYRQPAR